MNNINNNIDIIKFAPKPTPGYRLNEKPIYKKNNFDSFIKKIKDGESIVIRFIYPFKDENDIPQTFGIKYHQMQINRDGKIFYPRELCNKFINSQEECINCNREKEYLISSLDHNITEIGTITDINESKKRSEYINVGIVVEKTIIEENNNKIIKIEQKDLIPQIFQMGKTIFDDIIKYTNPMTVSK